MSTAEDWKWKPELGRWRPLQHGLPNSPHRVVVSTDGINERERYDYWRDLAFSDFEPDPAARQQNRPSFQARAKGLASARADFFVTESGSLAGGRTQRHLEHDGLDSLSIGIVLKGERRSQQHGDGAVRAGAGEFFLYDAAHASNLAWTGHKALYLVVRRPEVEAALGPVPRPSDMMGRMSRSLMRHVLADQFMMLARNMDLLRADEHAFVLDQTIRLALFALAGSPGEAPQSASADQTLLQVALRYIEFNLHDPYLNAAKLALAMNCSRATLYRAFSAYEVGIAETIADMRFDRARLLLETAPPERLVSDIALECGIYDTSNFSRQFRRRFGVAPSDVRPTA